MTNVTRETATPADKTSPAFFRALVEGVPEAIIVTALFFIASLMNLFALPHPVWFWVANLVLVPAAGWLALRLLGPDKPAESAG